MDINKASAEELAGAFQVDGTRARYLIERRPFKNWDEVKQVPGFEDVMVKHLQEAGLTIGAGHPASQPKTRQAGAGGGSRPDGGLDINSASAEELERVFQIDGERAHYLVQARNRIGGFKSWEDVKREAPSFDEGMVENLKRAGARIEGRRSR